MAWPIVVLVSLFLCHTGSSQVLPFDISQPNAVLLKVKDYVLVLEEGLSEIAQARFVRQSQSFTWLSFHLQLVTLGMGSGIQHASTILHLDDIVLGLDGPLLLVSAERVSYWGEVGNFIAIDGVEGILSVVRGNLQLNRHALGDLDKPVI